MSAYILVKGNLLDQPVDAIVNAWNRNIIPWWLLIPQGVSGAIKRRAGLAPFRELARHGPIPLGNAVLTGAGRLPHRAIIHVAGISMWWRSTPQSISASTRHALDLAAAQRFESIALPLIGAGTGGGGEDAVEHLMHTEIERHRYGGEVRLVRFAND
ncbi:macro domain-containing protein [Diaphorobacter caeni]|uniref:macro domain-containing protein n=1 Tax=Diaphorobacter caeni TaxID=2784387 RepID=UPI00188E2EC6|nr:macro domain-containing protein [Diaphorobacter caeni]MBF5004401.1 macro domain-containing protein [Diaphorobacter caeni]